MSRDWTRRSLATLGLALLAAGFAPGWAEPGTQSRPSTQPSTRPFAQTRPAPDASLEDLAWMEGRWEGESGGAAMEEHWTAPRGGLILGLHRDVFPSGRAMFEYLRIVKDDRGIAYLASPMGRPPTRFPLVSLDAGARRAVFENPDHDFPQRITYWLGRDGKLHARVEGEQDGETSGMEWSWSRSE